MYNDRSMKDAIVGKKITRIRMSDDYLILDTDQGRVSYYVEGDCCSRSRFFDFYGVRNLLDLGPVKDFEEVDLSPGDPGYRSETWADAEADEYGELRVYGYRFTVEHPVLGDMSAIVSFRNLSNGYYGGWMEVVGQDYLDPDLEDLTADKIGE